MKEEIDKKRVLITGGSGFIGTNLCEHLINKKYNFINLDIKKPKIYDHYLFWKKIDIRDRDALVKIVQDYKPTHVLNLAADLGMDHHSLDTLQTNIYGVENLIFAISSIESMQRIVFTSSLLVCENGYIPSDVTDYCAPNYYGESKVLGEKIVRKSNLKIDWAIVRPTSIWGPWFDYSYNTFFKMIDRGLYMHIGKVEFQKPASFVGNTVHMMMEILINKNPKINKKTFYLADYPWYSTRKWAKQIQKTLGTSRIKTAPFWLLKLIAKVGDFIKWIFRYDPPLTTFRLNNMMTGGEYFIKNTKEVCSDLPFSLKKSVYITSKWMYDKHKIKNKPKEI